MLELNHEVLDSFEYNSMYLYKTVLGITQNQFKLITRSDSKLYQFGFIEDDKSINPVGVKGELIVPVRSVADGVMALTSANSKDIMNDGVLYYLFFNR